MALCQAAQAMHRAHTPEDVYRAIGDELETLGYHAGVLDLGPGGSHLAPRYVSCRPGMLAAIEALLGLQARYVRAPLAALGLYEPLIARQESRYCEQTADLVARVFPEISTATLRRAAAMLGVSRAILAPLVVEDQVDGILVVVGSDLGEESIPAVTVFAKQAAIAIENARLLTRLAASPRLLRRLTQQVITVEEEERQRLAQALHDEAGQGLTALRLSLEMIGQDLPPELEELRQRIREVAQQTSSVLEALRSISYKLRPPALDVAGLSPALLALCHDFEKQTGLTIQYTGPPEAHASSAASVCLYRFAQEALTNAGRHARASRVAVFLEAGPDSLRLTVEDDGQGFDPWPMLEHKTWSPGLGLLGMQERLHSLNGRLGIWSQPGQGTRVVASIPTGPRELTGEAER